MLARSRIQRGAAVALLAAACTSGADGRDPGRASTDAGGGGVGGAAGAAPGAGLAPAEGGAPGEGAPPAEGGGTSGTPGFEPADGGAPAPAQPAPRGEPALVVTFAPFEVAPGAERTETQCQPLGNDAALLITAMELEARPGLHHSQAATRVEGEPPEKDRLFFGTTMGAREATWSLPEDHVTELPARSLLCLNQHTLNTTDAVTTAGATLRLWTTAPRAGLVHVAMFSLQTTAIELPAATERSATFTCTFREPVELLTLIPHTHGLGTRVSVARTAGPDGGAAIAAWDTLEDAPTHVLRPPLRLAPGEGLRVTCDYRNDTAHDVSYGTSAAEEMCLLAGLYAPADAFLLGLAGTDAGPCVASPPQ